MQHWTWWHFFGRCLNFWRNSVRQSEALMRSICKCSWAFSFLDCVDLIDDCEAGLPCCVQNRCFFAPIAIPSQSSILYVFKVLVLVVVVGLVSASTASASCGNYLYRNGKPVSDAHSSMNSHGSLRLDEMESTKIPVPPCHGPNCSKNPVPLMPVPAAPTTVSQGFDQAAILAALAQVPSPSGGNEIPESERGACFVPSSIFRPPIA
jgi:hypothetical protein